METTQIVWDNTTDGRLYPLFVKQRATTLYPTVTFRWNSIDDGRIFHSFPGFSGGVYCWSEYPNIRDVSMNCAKLGHNSDSDFGNTGYSLRSYLIKHGFITPAK